MLSTSDLRVFATIADEGSFSRAATRLHLAQPSVSEKVARLEGQLGTELFVRTNRGAELTSAGARLLPFARRCVALCEEAVSAVRADDAAGRFKVLMHSTYAPTIMPFVLDVLAPFQLEVSNNDAHSEHVVQAVADGTADAGFTIAVPHPHNVRLKSFYVDPVVAAVLADHPLAGVTDITIADVAAHRLAVNVWGDGADAFMDLLRAAPAKSTFVKSVSPAETAASLARVRGQIAVCTRSTVALDLAAGRLVELAIRDLPRWTVEVFLAYAADADADGPVSAILRAVTAIAGGPESWLSRPTPEVPD